MSSVRSFFAVPLSVDAEQQLDEACGPLQAALEHELNPEATLRWVAPANYHLTLAFLGNVQRRQLEHLHDIARDVAADAVPALFSLERFDWFPSPVKPRLLAALPGPSRALVDLQRELDRRLNQCGFHTEKRPFRPHITVARVKSVARPADLAQATLDIECELDELVLYASTQGRAGPVYDPLFVEPVGTYP